MTINETRTVRELAVEIPNALRVFDRFKIDYCCGGGQSLGDACSAAGVGLDEVARLLEEAGDATQTGTDQAGIASGSLIELVKYIVDTHHVFTRDEMARLIYLFEKVCLAHGGNHPELHGLRNLFAELCDDLAPHMFKEEQVLFPYIIRLEESVRGHSFLPAPPFGTVMNPVRMMMMEHDTAGDLLKAMRKLSMDYAVPPDACRSFQALYQGLEAFEADLHKHIHLENNILFPRAVEMESPKGN